MHTEYVLQGQTWVRSVFDGRKQRAAGDGTDWLRRTLLFLSVGSIYWMHIHVHRLLKGMAVQNLVAMLIDYIFERLDSQGTDLDLLACLLSCIQPDRL